MGTDAAGWDGRFPATVQGWVGLVLSVAFLVAAFGAGIQWMITESDKPFTIQLETINKRLDRMDGRLDRIEGRFDRTDERLDRIMELLSNKEGR